VGRLERHVDASEGIEQSQELDVIEYSEDVTHLVAIQLEGFFEGWLKRPSPETHLRILRSSFAAVIARDSANGSVVGFATAISDGVLAACIPLLEVRPAYRGRGIGSAIARRLLDRLEGLYMVDITCDPELVPFYERLGLQRSGAMIRRSRDAQRGRQ
jgi:GNAT superfamily N-acetyltransferase